MIDTLSSITWSVDHTAFSILGRDIRWYGICWATGVMLTALVTQKMFKAEEYPDNWFDSFFMYVLIGLIIGARLGHCLFYDPLEYLANPIDLLKIWEGGLASHGGAIGMVCGISLFSLKITNEKVKWKRLFIFCLVGAVVAYLGYTILHFSDPVINKTIITGVTIMGFSIGLCVALIYNSSPMSIKMLDKLVIGVAIGATFIRLGNLMNSEIYGGPTDLPWGFNFVSDPNWIGVPCHPTQLYEALTYFTIFLIGMFIYWKTNVKEKEGLILGGALIAIFGSRILIEFIKNLQEEFEADMLLNMGQLLSLPFVIWGIWLVWNALKKKTINSK